MVRALPPKNLPREYVEIWRALSDADQSAPSRQELARRLGVATHTLQRILVSGDVPRFPETKSRRTVHAWVRTLTRLAERLGHDPRHWIESVGIRWDETIQAVSRSTRRGPLDRPERRSAGIPQTASLSPPFPTRSILVGIVDREPFVGPLWSSPKSFLEEHATRLLKTIRPEMEVRCEVIAEADLIADLSSEGGRFDLGVGILGRVAHRANGIGQLTIPGWQTRLRAVRIHDVAQPHGQGGWSEAMQPTVQVDRRFLVEPRSAAHDHLTGLCALPPDQFIHPAGMGTRALADRLLEEQARRSSRSVLLVADESTCRRVVRDLIDRTEVRGRYAVEVIDDSIESPRFPICIGTRIGRAGWIDLLRSAQDEGLFGYGRQQTARLYAEVTAIDSIRIGWNKQMEVRSLGSCTVSRPFAYDDGPFREAFCRELLILVQSAHHCRLAGEETSLVAHEVGLSALTQAIAHSKELIANEWKETVDHVAKTLAVGARPESTMDHTAPAIPWCESCSAILSDGIHGGISDRYCRICADETGQLRDRKEVEIVLADWIRGFRTELSVGEARRRANRYMAKMPAWSEN